MRRLIGRVINDLMKTEDGELELKKYMRFKNAEEWKTHVRLMFLIRREMMEFLISEGFAALPLEEKDALQRAFSMVDQLIRFFAHPEDEINKRLKMKQQTKPKSRKRMGPKRKESA